MCNALNTFLDIRERNPHKATASLQKEQLLLVCCMEMYLSELPVLLHVLCDLVHISLALVLELLVYNLYCTEVSGTPHNTSTRYFTTATQRSYLIALNIFCIRVEKNQSHFLLRHSMHVYSLSMSDWVRHAEMFTEATRQ